MKDINIQLNELQRFLDFINERDKQLWNKYLSILHSEKVSQIN